MSDPVEEFATDEDLLLDIGRAVAGMDARLAGVEVALLGSSGGTTSRRRRARPRLPAGSLLRRARQRRGDAGGIIWSVWAFDELPPAERVDALRRIRDFADWLNAAYQLPLSTYAVPSCWYRHCGAVRELFALLAAYHDAYTTSILREASQPTSAPINWHDRMLFPCLRRLREEHGLRECVAAARHTEQLHQSIATDDGFGGAVEKLAATGWNS